MKFKLTDRIGEVVIDVQEKDDWIFFQRVKQTPKDPPVFLGMQLSVLAELFDSGLPNREGISNE